MQTSKQKTNANKQTDKQANKQTNPNKQSSKQTNNAHRFETIKECKKM